MIDLIFIIVFTIGCVYGITKEYAPKVMEWYSKRKQEKQNTITIKIKTRGDL